MCKVFFGGVAVTNTTVQQMKQVAKFFRGLCWDGCGTSRQITEDYISVSLILTPETSHSTPQF